MHRTDRPNSLTPGGTHDHRRATTQGRKDAEKIQKDALQARLDAVQPLIDELSKRDTLAERLAAVQAEMSDSDTTLATHYRAALDGGWTAKELSSAGLDVPKAATRKRPKPRTQATAPAAPVGDDAGEPQAPAA